MDSIGHQRQATESCRKNASELRNARLSIVTCWPLLRGRNLTRGRPRRIWIAAIERKEAKAQDFGEISLRESPIYCLD
jgi:hypothetical protein